MSWACINFLKTINGNRLKDRLNEYGVWKVTGEDPNCDFGGAHYEPILGYYEGELCKVIEIGVKLEGFWSWGAGGDFVKIDVKKIPLTDKEIEELI